jgi:hypothetical protein
MPQGLARRLASDSYQHHPRPSLAVHADDADEAEGSPGAQPLRHHQLAKSLWYIDALMEQLWELLHGQLTYIVWNYSTALHYS